ncbi:MAG: CotH kinase family protein [Chitinophagales bacterium]
MTKHFLITALLLLCSYLSFGQNGNNLFDDSFIHTIAINSIAPFSYEDFHDTLHTNYAENLYGSVSKPYFPTTLTIDGIVFDTVGVRYKGISSFEFAEAINKFPLKIDLNEFVAGQDYDGIKKINLNNNIIDVSYMRAKLSFEIMNRMGIVSPRVAYAEVYVNGSYRGLYSMVEQIDKKFVRNHYDPDNTGFLHKAYGLTVGFQTPFFSGQDTTDLNLMSVAPLKTKKSSNNYQPLRDFVVACNNSTDTEFENDVNDIFDLETFIDQQAVTMILGDSDHYCHGNSNFYLYLNPQDNKWYMIPWDYDLAFDALGTNYIEDPVNPPNFTAPFCLLNKRLFDIPSLRTRYNDALCKTINYGMDSLWIHHRIDEIKDLIGTTVENDPHFWDIPNFEDILNQTYVTDSIGEFLNNVNVPGIRLYINERFQQVRENLLNQDYICGEVTGLENTAIRTLNVTISPNPTNDVIHIEPSGIGEISRITVLNSVGQEVQTVVTSENRNDRISIDLTTYTGGIYYIRFEGNGETINFLHKVIKL